MEIKEAVDVLSLILSVQGREPSPEEIRRAGFGILSLADGGKVGDHKPLIDKHEVEVEFKRALNFLELSKNKLKGEALAAVMDLEGSLRRKLEAFVGEAEEEKNEHEYEVKVDERIFKGDAGTVSKTGKGAGGGDHDAEGAPDATRHVAVEEDDLPQRIRKKRLSLGLRQKDLAEMLGISSAYLSLIENGKINEPSEKVLQRITTFLEGQTDLIPGTLSESTPSSRVEEGGEVSYSSEVKPKGPAVDVEGGGDKPVALRRLLEAALSLEARELELLVAVAEALSKINRV